MNALNERRLQIWEEMRTTIDASEGRSMTAEELGSYEKMEKELNSLTSTIEAERRHASLVAVMDSSTGTPVKTENSQEKESDVEYRGAFNQYLRMGDAIAPELRAMLVERRAQGVDIDSAGGFLVPEEFRAKMIETLKQFGGFRTLAEGITTTNGAAMLYPTVNTTNQVGMILAENTTAPEEDISFGQKEIGSYTYTSKLLRVSRQLLQDSAFDLDSWLPGKLGERIARAQAPHWIVGTDVNQPQGVVTGRDLTKDVDLAVAGTITGDDIIDLSYRPDIAYRGNAWFVMNDSVAASIRKLKDGDGRYLWEMSYTAGQPDRLFGYPIMIDNAMPAKSATVGEAQILFGDFSRGYLIRDVAGAVVMRLVERFAELNQVGFIGFTRADGMVQDNQAYAALIN